MKTVAIYIRVSTDKQEARNQLDALADYCKKSNYTIYAVYPDVMSGKENARPNYERMFADAHKKLFNLVLFWDLSRFSRSGTLYTLQKLKELENLGIEWESYQERYFRATGEFKDVLISIMSTLAKIEREKISERTKAGLRHAKNVGKRGKDKKPRKRRADRGIKRGGQKNPHSFIKENQVKDGRL